MNNREIKFEYGFESVNGIVKKVYHLHEIPFIKDKCDVWDVLPIKYVRQYTGLKDKNGVEIYEGDIVKWGHIAGGLEKPVRVARVDLYPSLKFEIIKDREKFFKPRFEYGSFIYTDTEKWLEVIGNIHQNPELLNK